MGSMSMYSSSRADRPTDSNVSDLEDVILGLGLCLGGSVAGRGGGSEGRREGAEGGRGGGGWKEGGGSSNMPEPERLICQLIAKLTPRSGKV